MISMSNRLASTSVSEKANSTQTLPMLDRLLQSDHLLPWQMNPAEQAMMIYLLERLRPKVAIEIGTRFGGSLQVIAQYSERVYSLDIDPEVTDRLKGRFSNVEYLIGPSDQTLPALIERLQREEAEVCFVLVDGDHTAPGLRKDINNLLKLKPTVPMHVLMHDSMNPVVRHGLSSASWPGCPYVHRLELDFVPGGVSSRPEFRGQLWDGFALAILEPTPRVGDLKITASSQMTFQAADRAFSPGLIRKALNRLARMRAERSAQKAR
jgi:Cephalosporin hydroxylase